MARGHRLQAAHHREVAAEFRALAHIEPSDSLRQHLQRLAERHDGLAAGLELDDADKGTAEPAGAWRAFPEQRKQRIEEPKSIG